MITSLAVGAVFSIEDLASGPANEIANAFEMMAGAARGAKDALLGFGQGLGLGAVAKELTAISEALAGVAGDAGRAASAMAGIGVAAAESASAVRGLAGTTAEAMAGVDRAAGAAAGAYANAREAAAAYRAEAEKDIRPAQQLIVPPLEDPRQQEREIPNVYGPRVPDEGHVALSFTPGVVPSRNEVGPLGDHLSFGGGRGGRGGGRGGGPNEPLRIEGPDEPFGPDDRLREPGARPRNARGGHFLGLVEAGEALEVGEGYLQAARMEQDIEQAVILGLGIHQDNPGYAGAIEKVTEGVRTARSGTVVSLSETAGFLPDMAKLYGPAMDDYGKPGIVDNFLPLFVAAVKGAEAAQQSKAGTAEQSVPALMEYAHLTGTYSGPQATERFNTLRNVATSADTTIAAQENILKYAMPTGMAAGMNPDDVAIGVGYLEAMGLRNSTAGTSYARMIGTVMTAGEETGQVSHEQVKHLGEERNLRSALEMRPEEHDLSEHVKGDESNAKRRHALHELGLTDSHGKLTVLDEHGNMDQTALFHRIAEFAQDPRHSKQESLSVIKDLFETQAGRAAGLFRNEEVVDRFVQYDKNIRAAPSAEQAQQIMSGTTYSAGIQVVKRFEDLMNDVVTGALPALNVGLHYTADALETLGNFVHEHPLQGLAGAAAVGAGTAYGAGRIFKGAVSAVGRWWNGVAEPVAEGAATGGAEAATAGAAGRGLVGSLEMLPGIGLAIGTLAEVLTQKPGADPNMQTVLGPHLGAQVQQRTQLPFLDPVRRFLGLDTVDHPDAIQGDEYGPERPLPTPPIPPQRHSALDLLISPAHAERLPPAGQVLPFAGGVSAADGRGQPLSTVVVNVPATTPIGGSVTAATAPGPVTNNVVVNLGGLTVNTTSSETPASTFSSLAHTLAEKIGHALGAGMSGIASGISSSAFVPGGS